MDVCRRKLAYHEAGHWIVSKAAGFKVGEIVLTVHRDSIDPNRNIYHFHGSGSSHIDPEPTFASIKDIDDYLLKRMATLIAGVSAQKLVDELGVDEIWASNAADDRGKLDELTFLLRGIRYPGQISMDTEKSQRLELVNEAGEIAKKYLDNNFQVLSKMTEFLIAGVKVSNRKFTFHSKDLEEIFKAHHG